MSDHNYPLTPEGFLQWLTEASNSDSNDIDYRFIKFFETKLSEGIEELSPYNYGSLEKGWKFDSFKKLHKYIDSMLANKSEKLIENIFIDDPELSSRARRKFRTAIDRYSRFVRGVSPKFRLKEDFFRQHFMEKYVNPSRQAGRRGFIIDTEDVMRDLQVVHDEIYISETALEDKFKEQANVEYDGEEPSPRKKLILKFRFLGETEEEISSPTQYERTNTMRPPSLNQVFYGPPGTGKTYRTSEEAVRICDGDVSEDRNEYMARYKELMEEGRIEFVTFHQSFSYEDFVEGLRPFVSSEQSSSGGFRLRVRNGVFKKIERRARIQGEPKDDMEWADDDSSSEEEVFLGRYDPDNPNLPYVLIIDELNRANISKVLGELITLLEEDKRIGNENEIKVQLPYSGERFGVTSNLYIIGTMNTADRSIALLDTALRRRFEFHEVMPDPSILGVVDGINLKRLLQFINDNIENKYDRDHQIGHSYFINCKNRFDIEIAMRNHVIPLLTEYFYNRGEDVAEVLGDKDTIDSGAGNVGNFMLRTGIGSTGSFRYSVRPEGGFDFGGFEQ